MGLESKTDEALLSVLLDNLLGRKNDMQSFSIRVFGSKSAVARIIASFRLTTVFIHDKAEHSSGWIHVQNTVYGHYTDQTYAQQMVLTQGWTVLDSPSSR
jgi:hypothetical protein